MGTGRQDGGGVVVARPDPTELPGRQGPARWDLPITVLIDPTVRGARRRKAVLTTAHPGEDLTEEPAHLVRSSSTTSPTGRQRHRGTHRGAVYDPRPRPGPSRRTGRRLPSTVGGRNRQRPAQNPPPRARADPALPPTGAGPPRDLGVAAGPLPDQRPDHPSRAGRRSRPRPGLLHPGPAPDPPHRHRYGGFPPEAWDEALPAVLAEITRKPNPARRDRTCPRAVKRTRHNSYRVKKPGEHAIRHPGPPTTIRTIQPRAA